MPSKNMLVTGSAGFIGSCFVQLMLSRYPSLNIVSLDKLTYAGSLKNLDNLLNSQHHTFIQGNIADPALIATLLRDYQIDTIVHFAAESHVDNSIAGPEIFVQSNIVGTFHLLEQARLFWQHEKKWDNKQCRFHHVSTDEVYGSLTAEDPAFTEITPYAPNSPYSASKAGSDHLARAYFHTYQLPITLSNCSNNYGPRQHAEKLIPVVIRTCIMQQAIPVYGDGKNIRDWLHVEDHCDAIDVILQKGRIGERYNIGGKNEWDNLALVHKICEIMDEFYPEKAPHKKLIQFVTDRQGHDRRYAIDNTKIQAELSWYPSYDFESGLRKTVESFVDLPLEI